MIAKTLCFLGLTAAATAKSISIKVDLNAMKRVCQDWKSYNRSMGPKYAKVIRPVIRPLTGAYARAYAKTILNIGRIYPKMVRAWAKFVETNLKFKGNVNCIASCATFNPRNRRGGYIGFSRSCFQKKNCGRLTKAFSNSARRAAARNLRRASRSYSRFFRGVGRSFWKSVRGPITRYARACKKIDRQYMRTV